MSSLNDLSTPLSLLETRKSATVKAMTGPGPTEDQLMRILKIAVRVPDHGKLAPWRFILFEGKQRAKFGKIMRKRWHALHPDHGGDSLDFQAKLFERAPLVLAVVSRAAPHAKIPEWEQQLSAGAVCQNILLAAAALGIGAQWNTDWIAYDAKIARKMGLGEHERIAGLIYFGTPALPLEDRPRPDPAALLTRWEKQDD